MPEKDSSKELSFLFARFRKGDPILQFSRIENHLFSHDPAPASRCARREVLRWQNGRLARRAVTLALDTFFGLAYRRLIGQSRK